MPGWFLGIHCFTKYVNVAFFRGTSLRPLPPGESKQKDVRYFHVYEDDQIVEAQFAAWVKQASQLPANECEGQCDVRAWRERSPSHQPASPRASVSLQSELENVEAEKWRLPFT